MVDFATFILIRLIIAYLITEYFINPEYWIKNEKKKSVALIIHSVLSGFIPFIALWNINYWYIIVIFSVSHFLIYRKKRNGDGLGEHIVYQSLHIAIVLLVWLTIVGSDYYTVYSDFIMALSDYRLNLIVIGLLFLTIPTSILIERKMKRWKISTVSTISAENAEEVYDVNYSCVDESGLTDAGKFIGYTERIIIFLLILANQFTALGLVITTKSIFRLKTGSIKAEYVLVGSMLSFSIAIIVGLFFSYLINL
jgi:hypothetical protein